MKKEINKFLYFYRFLATEKRKKSIAKIEGKKKDNKKSAFYDKIYTKKTRKKSGTKERVRDRVSKGKRRKK